MEIKLDGGGKLMEDAPKQKWSDDSLLQTAVFAGLRMMAITDDKGGYRLNYLNYETGGFKSMDEARAAGPEFAKAVLNRMLSQILPAPTSDLVSPTL